MNAYDLPTSLMIGGVARPIRTGWRVIMDIFAMFYDPELDSEMKSIGLIKILYPRWQEIPAGDMQEALDKACEFIDCGQAPDGRPRPRVVDWETDWPLILPAINQIANIEVREHPDIHWWTFFGWYMSIEKSLFSSVILIRQKKAEGKKLEKHEKEWYTKNKNLVDMKKRRTAEEQAEMDALLKWLK